MQQILSQHYEGSRTCLLKRTKTVTMSEKYRECSQNHIICSGPYEIMPRPPFCTLGMTIAQQEFVKVQTGIQKV